MPRSRHEASDLALDHAPAVLEIAKAAAELAPVPGLGLVVDVLSSILDRVKEVRANSENAAAFIEKAKQLDVAVAAMLRDASSATDGPGRVALQERLERLSSTLVEIRVSAGELRGGAGFRGGLKGFMYAQRNEAILEDMNEKMKDAITLFHLRGQAAVEIALNSISHDAKIVRNVVIETGAAVSGIGHDIKDVQHSILDAGEERNIYYIPHAAAGYHSVDELKSGFMQGTRGELFEQLERWALMGLSPPPSILEQLYFLSGGAGLGKSSIAHQLCTRIAERWRLNLGASFFFSRGRGDLESARYMFSTIAHQLALSQPLLRSYITAAVPNFLKDGEQQQMLKTFERLLWAPLTQFAASGDEQPVTFVIIDGLDECKDRALVPDLLRCLLQLVRSLPWLRIVVAARPEPHIMPYLSSAGCAGIVYHRSLNDTVGEWRDDVATYLRATVPQLQSCREYVRANPDTLNQLISRANGVFIYARVAVNFLEAFDDDPEETFALLLGARDSGLPPIDNLYLHVLRLAFPAEYLRVMPERAERLRGLLTFLALRTKDLSPAAIAALLGLSENNVVKMVDRLRSVLLINEEGKVVPLHAIFAEFLLDAHRCIDPLYHIDWESGHALLASKCLAAFSFNIATVFLASVRDGTNEGLTSYVRYTEHWDEHLENARYSTELSQQLQDLVSIQLPVFTRLHGKMDCSEALAAFLEPSYHSAAFCAEYRKSNQYCYQWWWARIQEDYSGDARAIAIDTDEVVTDDPVKISQYLNSELSAGTTGHTVSREDLARYGAIIEDFAMQIRTSGSEILWYDRQLNAGWDWE